MSELKDDFGESTQKKRLEGLSGKKEPLLHRSIRLTQSDKDALERHFSEQGLGLSAGIRLIIREYIRKNGLV